ncbi:hypothetical protein [Amycolatopsis sp. NPDC021455]|uniref:hypothetical protein n=1 Tax=Amycolatopsis sp. NPDC021455 TaxID=3154901 RepID=UPI0033F3DADC
MNRIEEAAGVQAGALVRLQVAMPVVPVSCAATAAEATARLAAHAAFGKAAGWGLAFIAATAAAYGAGVAHGYAETRDDVTGEVGVRGGLSAGALLRTRTDLVAA